MPSNEPRSGLAAWEMPGVLLTERSIAASMLHWDSLVRMPETLAQASNGQARGILRLPPAAPASGSNDGVSEACSGMSSAMMGQCMPHQTRTHPPQPQPRQHGSQATIPQRYSL